NSACSRLPTSRPCMSVNAQTTVSIAPRSTSPRSSSSLSIDHNPLGPAGALTAPRSTRVNSPSPTKKECNEHRFPRRPAAAPPARLRPGALSLDGRLPDLGDLVPDLLNLRRLPNLVLLRVYPGRAVRD